MIRFFDIVREFESAEHEFEKMTYIVGRDYKNLVLHLDKVYCPIKGSRVFEVNHIIVPAVIEFEPFPNFMPTRTVKETLKRRRERSYIAIGRTHQIVIFKLPGMEQELVTKLIKIDTHPMKLTNFDKKAGY